jgi:mRNA interferase HigB
VYFARYRDDIVETYIKSRAGHRGIKAARAQYDAWLAIAETADWKTPEEVKKAHPKASILNGGRVVFNIKLTIFGWLPWFSMQTVF